MSDYTPIARAIVTTLAADLALDHNVTLEPWQRDRLTRVAEQIIKNGLTKPDAFEVNPESPALIQVRNQWHQLCALTLAKLEVTRVLLTPTDIENFQKAGDRALLLHMHRDSIELKLVPKAEAERLARTVEALGGATVKP